MELAANNEQLSLTVELSQGTDIERLTTEKAALASDLERSQVHLSSRDDELRRVQQELHRARQQLLEAQRQSKYAAADGHDTSTMTMTLASALSPADVDAAAAAASDALTIALALVRSARELDANRGSRRGSTTKAAVSDTAPSQSTDLLEHLRSPARPDLKLGLQCGAARSGRVCAESQPRPSTVPAPVRASPAERTPHPRRSPLRLQQRSLLCFTFRYSIAVHTQFSPPTIPIQSPPLVLN